MKTMIATLSALSLCAMRGPIHRSTIRFDKAMTEEEFQEKVLEQQKASKKAIDEITTKFANTEKETKKAYDDLLKSVNDTNAKAEAIEVANKKLNLQIARERSNALSSPIKRITDDTEKCARMAAMVCLASTKDGGYRKLAKKVLDDAGIVGKAEGEDSGFGSDLITPDLARDIYDSLLTYGAYNSLGMRRLSTKVTELPVKTARAAFNWLITEGAAIAEDTTKAGTSVNATVRPLGGLISVSRQLLEDSPLDVVADVMDDFVEGYAECIDYAAFVANGTTDNTNGGYTGIFSGGTASVAAATHTSFASLTYTDVLNTMLAVDPVVLKRQARWWMHPFALVTLMGIKDTTGRPIFQSILERPAPNAVGSLLGYPITLVSNAPYTSGVSAPFIAFGDPNSQVVGIRHDFQFEYSDDYHFNTWQRAFRGIGRAAIAMRKATAFAVLTTAAS